jgi:Ca2+-binding RTX toxin-like protein
MKLKTSIIGMSLIMISMIFMTSDSFAQQNEVLCDGIPATIVAKEGEEIIAGTPADDVIHGLDIAKIIHGHGGNDIICAYGDNTKIMSGIGHDRNIILGGQGSVIVGGDGHDYCQTANNETARQCETVINIPVIVDDMSEEEPRTFSLKTNQNSYAEDDTLILSGAVLPEEEGVKVVLQILFGLDPIFVNDTKTLADGTYSFTITPEDSIWRGSGTYTVKLFADGREGPSARFLFEESLPETSESFLVSDGRIRDATNPSNVITSTQVGTKVVISNSVNNDQSKEQSFVQRVSITGPETETLEFKGTFPRGFEDIVRYEFTPFKSGDYVFTITTEDDVGTELAPATILNLNVTGTDRITLGDLLQRIIALEAEVAALKEQLAQQ